MTSRVPGPEFSGTLSVVLIVVTSQKNVAADDSG